MIKSEFILREICIFKAVVVSILFFVLISFRTLTAQPQPNNCGDKTVAIVVESSLIDGIRDKLNQFENDLCSSGYNTTEHSSDFANPPLLREYLAGLYEQTNVNLTGTILMGDVPHAYQEVPLSRPDLPPYQDSEEVISFQYYADLNGSFTKSADYTSPSGQEYSYNEHTGNVEWEIWVGVLPRYKGDLQSTITAINAYFDKNHDYRTGQLQRPSVFLEINEHYHATTLSEHYERSAWMRSGQYSWTPYSNSEGSRLYFDSPPGGLSPQQGYADMQNGVADFTVHSAHGSWYNTGGLSISEVETDPVKTIFYWSDGCAVGNLDQSDNFLSSILYSPNSDVIVAKGTTNNSGGMGNNSNGFYGHNIASAMYSGANFGDAIMNHINVPLIEPWANSREFHFGTIVILGDPTLRRLNSWQEQESYSQDCSSRPEGTVCARYSDGFIWLVNNSIHRWEREGSVQTAIGKDGKRYQHILDTNSVRVTF